jgi:predicted DNA-binding transcriptional regulator YafY
MSAGKNPYHRYYILNACFTNRYKRKWTKVELLRKLADNDFDISPRTLDDDIYNMRHDDQLKMYAPIIFSKKDYAYYYEDPDYSIDKLQLTDDQLRAFEAIVHLMQPYKGTQMVREFEGAIEKIIRGVDQLRRQRVNPDHQTIAVEHAPYYKGYDFLDPIKNAIDLKQPVRIQYQKFNTDNVDEYVFHPYLLKEYKGRWYVLGFSERRHYTVTLGLDRIQSLETVDKPFREDKKLKPEAFFKNTIGITHTSGPVEDIVLWFSRSMGNYIKTQHLHPSQEVVKDTTDGLVISLKLRVNYELLSLLLSYVPDVAVLQPSSLREKFQDALIKGLEQNKVRRP